MELKLNLSVFLQEAIECLDSIKKLHLNGLYGLNFELDLNRISEHSIKNIFNRRLNHHNNQFLFWAPERFQPNPNFTDQLTDIYSFGILLYVKATGTLPYVVQNETDWPEAHRLWKPVEPIRLNKQIPSILSDIILKTIAKSPANRYQSAESLQYDLKLCLEGFQSGSPLEDFELGTLDKHWGLKFPEHLGGFNTEKRLLRDVVAKHFDDSHLTFIMLRGRIGSGKKYLLTYIETLIKDYYESDFVFVDLEENKQNLPLQGLREIINGLGHLVATKPPELLNKVKSEVERRIGGNSPLFSKLLPELEYIFKNEPSKPGLPRPEEKNYVANLLDILLTALTSNGTHLTLNIANFHCLDKDSLIIVQQTIQTNPKLPLLVSCTIREIEPGVEAPLEKLVSTQLLNWAKSLSSHAIVEVLGLNRRELSDFIAEALRCKEIDIRQLSNIIYEKLGGNPLVTFNTLGNLLQNNLVTLNTDKNLFEWNEPNIITFLDQINPIDLMNDKIKKLSDENLYCLQLMAAMGMKAELSTLTLLLNKNRKDIIDFLTKAVKENIISLSGGRAQFLHHHYREVLYNSTDTKRREEFHLTVAKFYESLYFKSHETSILYHAVEHFYSAINSMSAEEFERFIGYTYQCGLWSFESRSYSTAIFYFEQTLKIIDYQKSIFNKEKLFDLIYNLAKLYYFTGAYERVDRILEELDWKSLALHQRVDILTLRIDILVTSGEMAGALKIGFDFLASDCDLKLTFPKSEQGPKVKFICETFPRWVSTFWLSPKFCEDYQQQNVLKVLKSLLLPAHFIQSPILTNLATEGVLITLNSGFNEAAIPCFLWFALSLISSPHPNLDLSFEIGRFTSEAVEKFSLNNYKAQVRVLFWNVIAIYKKSLRNNRFFLLEAIAFGKDTGDINFTCYAFTHTITNRLFLGDPLEEVYSQALEFQKNSIALNEPNFEKILQSQIIFINSLLNEGRLGHHSRAAQDPRDKNLESRIRQSQMGLLKFWYYILKIQSEYINGRINIARSLLARSLHLRSTDQLYLESTQFVFYGSLVILRQCIEAGRPLNTEEESLLVDFRQHLEGWATSCPSNFLAQHYFVEAKFSALKGEVGKSLQYYSKALKWAKEQRLTPLIAIIAESMYRHYNRLWVPEIAFFYLRESIEAYRQWGATKKVRHLQNIKANLPGAANVQILDPNEDDIYYPSELEELTKKVWDVSEDNQIAFIIDKIVSLTHCEKLILGIQNAEGKLDLLQHSIYPHSSNTLVPIVSDAESVDVPFQIFNYVSNTGISLWGEVEIIPPQLKKSKYIKTHHPDSLGCYPIEIRGKNIGVIYLENLNKDKLYNPQFRKIIEASVKILAGTKEMLALKQQLLQEQALLRRTKQESVLSEQVFENSRDSIFVLDSEFRIISINRAFSQMTGYSKSEIKGLPIGKLYFGINSREILQRTQTDLQQKGYWQGDLQSRKKNGEIFSEWLSLVAVRDDESRAPKYIGIFFDLADRKKMEQALKQAKDEAENAVKVRSQFLANISHEIRTPMNAILGLSELGLEGVSEATAKSYFGKINLSASHLLNLINDVLDFSKIEAGKLKLNEESFDCRKLVEEIISMMSIRAQEKNLNLKLQYPSDLPNIIYSDSMRLRQILMNLISNAIKFTIEGSVSVSVDKKLSANNDPGLRFSVKDTGVGIKKQDQELLFQPFSQIDATSTRRFGGTGLGLAICYELINLLGGTINVESTPGKGSTFWFEIPLKEMPAGASVGNSAGEAEPPLSTLVQPTSPPINCLLVEDNIINQIVAREMLKSCNTNVKVVNNGQEAVEELAEHPGQYQIVFMDIQMPQLDGYAATEFIRQKLALIDLPIIGLTAHAFKEERDRCYQVGMTEVLSKPVKRSDLFRVINRFSNPVPVH